MDIFHKPRIFKLQDEVNEFHFQDDIDSGGNLGKANNKNDQEMKLRSTQASEDEKILGPESQNTH